MRKQLRLIVVFMLLFQNLLPMKVFAIENTSVNETNTSESVSHPAQSDTSNSLNIVENNTAETSSSVTEESSDPSQEKQTEIANNEPVEPRSSPSPRTAVDQTSNNYTNVTKDNFLDYFTVNGSATYDKSTGTVTLTPAQTGKSGNFSSKTKIDTTKSFKLTGQTNLGADPNGADGIGIFFHPNSSSASGTAGAALGIGGLNNAFGFKLDTYFNGDSQTNAAPDPSSMSGGPFGTFVYNQGTTANSYTGADAPPQRIDKPSNVFKDIDLSYNGTTKVLTVTYEGKTWSKDVTSWIKDNNLIFGMSASTDGLVNQHQFRIESFDFETVPGKLQTSKTVDKSTVKTGDTITYTLAVKNSVADSTLHNINVKDDLSSGLQLVPNSLTVNGTAVSNDSTNANGIETTIDSINWGVYSYGDIGLGEETKQELALGAHSIADVSNSLNTMQSNGGGDTPEDSIQAPMKAISETSWRKGAQRFVIVIKDAPAKERSTITIGGQPVTANGLKNIAAANSIDLSYQTILSSGDSGSSYESGVPEIGITALCSILGVTNRTSNNKEELLKDYLQKKIKPSRMFIKNK